MKKMVLLATVVGVVALIMAAAPAMATERNGHDGALFNNGGVFISNGNVGFNTGFNTGFGFNGCCNTGFDGCFNFGCNNNVFFTPNFGFDGCFNCNHGFVDRDDFINCWWCNKDRDDFRRNHDRDDFKHNHDMDRR